MKKYGLAAMPLLFYLAVSCYANAQYTQSEKGIYRFSIAAARSYTPDGLVAESPKKDRLYLNSISIKAVRDFMKRHVNAENESWIIMERGGFRARFNANGTDITEYYNKHGNWTNSLKMYKEAQLSFKLRAMVKRIYYDYEIECIYEIETIKSDNRPTYIIRVQDEHSFIFLRIRDGQMCMEENG